jgi:hypothetical protein
MFLYRKIIIAKRNERSKARIFIRLRQNSPQLSAGGFIFRVFMIKNNFTTFICLYLPSPKYPAASLLAHGGNPVYGAAGSFMKT